MSISSFSCRVFWNQLKLRGRRDGRSRLTLFAAVAGGTARQQVVVQQQPQQRVQHHTTVVHQGGGYGMGGPSTPNNASASRTLLKHHRRAIQEHSIAAARGLKSGLGAHAGPSASNQPRQLAAILGIGSGFVPALFFPRFRLFTFISQRIFRVSGWGEICFPRFQSENYMIF